MIITTTNSIEGRSIREYRGIAFGEVITGIDMFRDLGASLTNIFGGRSAGYEDELQDAREEGPRRVGRLFGRDAAAAGHCAGAAG